MGYACPVCGDPQADARHLANHLAFTALARGGDHEQWLDDHVPDWEDHGEAWLSDRVVDHADEEEFPQVFEDTTDGGSGGERIHDHEHGHAHDHEHTHEHDQPRDAEEGLGSGVADVSEAAVQDALARIDDGDRDPEDVLAEARELTRKRRESDDESETE